MSKLIKATVASLALLAAVAASAQAQQDPSVANLPPQTPSTSAATPPVAVAPSPKYVGPGPGANDASNGTAYQKPANYDNDVNMHPYTAPGMGPKAH